MTKILSIKKKMNLALSDVAPYVAPYAAPYDALTNFFTPYKYKNKAAQPKASRDIA